MTTPLKAYVCFSAHETPSDGCFLVFAESRNKAREMTYADIGDYVGTSARRVKSYDHFAGDRPQVMSDNDMLPDGAPPFFWDGFPYEDAA